MQTDPARLTVQYRCGPVKWKTSQMRAGHLEDNTDAGWSYGRQYRCGLVIWKTLQMRAGHLEDITDEGWSYGRHYRCGQVIWKTLQMRAGHMEDFTDAGWSYGRHYRGGLVIWETVQVAGVTRQQNCTEAGWKDRNKSTGAGRSGWYKAIQVACRYSVDKQLQCSDRVGTTLP
jgi:hypothetical protein